MQDTKITVSGTVTNPNLKRGDMGYVIETFTFDVTVPMPESLDEALTIDRKKVWANHYLQTKIDYLNKFRTAHITKRLEALGFSKQKRTSIPPELVAMANKVLAAKQTMSPEQFAKVQEALKAAGLDI